MAKSSRRRKIYRKSASKFHKTVGNLLFSIPSLKGLRIYQEYPVKQINPAYKNFRARYDWAILELKTVIECHGKQHFEPVRFGGISEEEAKEKFKQQKYMDAIKEEAAINAGWKYVVVPYNMKITKESLLDLILGEDDENP